MGFSIPFLARWPMPQAGCLLLFSIQPFANIVGNYTSHNRENKSYKRIYKSTLPSVPVQGVATLVFYHTILFLTILLKILHYSSLTSRFNCKLTPWDGGASPQGAGYRVHGNNFFALFSTFFLVLRTRFTGTFWFSEPGSRERSRERSDSTGN